MALKSIYAAWKRKTKGKRDSTVINNLKEILTRREKGTGDISNLKVAKRVMA